MMAILSSSAVAGAQSGAGGMPDATVPRAGALRVGIRSSWAGAVQQFGTALGGGSTLQDIGAERSSSDVTPELLPGVPGFASAASAIRALVGAPPLRVSLGSVRVRGDTRITTLPFSIEYGLTNRLSVGVLVPVVHVRQSVSIAANVGDTSAASITATAGFNPARQTTADSLRVVAIGQQFSAANTQLRNKYPQCFTATPASGCSSVITLESTSRAFAASVTAVYGASMFVPTGGSTAHDSVLARLASFNDQFRTALQLAATVNPIAARPRGAAPAGVADVQRLVTDATYGTGADSLGGTERVEIGDVEVGVALALGGTRNAMTQRGWRGLVSATYIAGTGKPVRPAILLDLPTGTGQNGVAFRGTIDAFLGRRLWSSVSARFVWHAPDDRTLRLDSASVLLPLAAWISTTHRELGPELSFDITPRYALSEYFGAMLAYRFTRVGSSTLMPGIGSSSVTIPLNVLAARSSQEVGLGLAYSTVAAVTRRRAGLPVDVSILHRETIAGSSGALRLASDQVELRVYAPLFGR